MKALVIYESFFGNTEQIAQAVAETLAARADVVVKRVSEVPPQSLAGLDLLVVGSATRAFQPSPGTKAWLAQLPADSLRGVKVAAFDTHIPIEGIKSKLARALLRPLLTRYAAKPIANALQGKGGALAVPPEGFGVQGTEGPLVTGELERARAWANQILAAV